jgi:tyrosine-protein phosphatase non-receptor type 4
VDNLEDEPIYQYVAENLSNAHANRDPFTQSMLLLADGLASGTLLNHYEQLYRRNSNLAITEARKPEHVNKNRYRDISPCKCESQRTAFG